MSLPGPGPVPGLDISLMVYPDIIQDFDIPIFVELSCLCLVLGCGGPSLQGQRAAPRRFPSLAPAHKHTNSNTQTQTHNTQTQKHEHTNSNTQIQTLK